MSKTARRRKSGLGTTCFLSALRRRPRFTGHKHSSLPITSAPPGFDTFLSMVSPIPLPGVTIANAMAMALPRAEGLKAYCTDHDLRQIKEPTQKNRTPSSGSLSSFIPNFVAPPPPDRSFLERFTSWAMRRSINRQSSNYRWTSPKPYVDSIVETPQLQCTI